MLTKIKEMRKRINLTQGDLANQLSVTQGAVSQWESGLTNPTLEMLVKIAAVLQCTVDELLHDEDDKER